MYSKKRNLEKNRKVKCIIIGLLAIIIFGVVLFIFYQYSNEIDEKTINVTPLEIISGKELTEDEIIPVKSAYCVASIGTSDFMTDMITNAASVVSKPISELNDYIGLLDDIKAITGEKVDLEELKIPVHAAYSGTGLILDEDMKTYVTTILNLDSRWFYQQLHMYGWNKTYNLNNGTKVKETHMILIAGDIYLYEKIQIKGNQQGECEILGGGIVNED